MGLVGTGYWAETVHAPGLAAHPAIDFIGVWRRDPAKAAELARRHDATAFEAPQELFASVEAVAFAVSPAAQPALASEAARAGCHLRLEKPIATGYAQKYRGGHRAPDRLGQAKAGLPKHAVRERQAVPASARA